MRKIPPNVEQVKLALAHCSGEDRYGIALHLALPSETVVGIGATRKGRTWLWRGLEEPELGDPAEMACRLAARGIMADDSYLDLDAPPERWLKIMTSGSRRIAFGSELLFGGPALIGEDSFTDEHFFEAGKALKSGVSEPGLIRIAGQRSALVDSSEESWFLRSAEQEAAPSTEEFEMDAESVASEMENELGMPLVGVMEIGKHQMGVEHEIYFQQGRWRVVVPVILGSGVLKVGVDTYGLLDAPDAQCPEGWRWRGWDPWSNSWVAEHVTSGILGRFS